jgi:hypothetical protein
VFLNQSWSFAKKFFCPTETSGVDSGNFCDRYFGISNPYELSNEISVERQTGEILEVSCVMCKNRLK